MDKACLNSTLFRQWKKPNVSRRPLYPLFACLFACYTRWETWISSLMSSLSADSHWSFIQLHISWVGNVCSFPDVCLFPCRCVRLWEVARFFAVKQPRKFWYQTNSVKVFQEHLWESCFLERLFYTWNMPDWVRWGLGGGVAESQWGEKRDPPLGAIMTD